MGGSGWKEGRKYSEFMATETDLDKVVRVNHKFAQQVGGWVSGCGVGAEGENGPPVLPNGARKSGL